MRWLFICVESLASGVLAVLASLITLIVALQFYSRHLGVQAIGWDPVSLFGSHWKLVLIGIPLAIVAGGFAIAFWFLSQRVHR